MVTIKNAECGEALQALAELCQMEISVKTAYKIARLTRLVRQQTEDFGEVRMALIEKHGKRDEEGNLIINKETNQYKIEDTEAFNKQILELFGEAGDDYNLRILLDELPEKIKPGILVGLGELVEVGELV